MVEYSHLRRTINNSQLSHVNYYLSRPPHISNWYIYTTRQFVWLFSGHFNRKIGGNDRRRLYGCVWSAHKKRSFACRRNGYHGFGFTQSMWHVCDSTYARYAFETSNRSTFRSVGVQQCYFLATGCFTLRLTILQRSRSSHDSSKDKISIDLFMSRGSQHAHVVLGSSWAEALQVATAQNGQRNKLTVRCQLTY